MDLLKHQSSDPVMSRHECLDFELLYLLETEPELGQREIAARLGISLGHVNNRLKILMSKGSIEFAKPGDTSDKSPHAYRLTPSGASNRLAQTERFLRDKLAEYERLKAQIDDLQRTVARPIDKNIHGGS